MKKYISLVMTLVMGFCFIGSVNAEEADLSSIASISSVIGGSDKEIIQTDSSNTYKFYYKYVAIDSEDFSTYVSAKYMVDNSSDSSEEYATASEQVSEYESVFYDLIPEVSAADLDGWTLANDGEINLSDLTYVEGSHNGYVLAVAAVKEGDTKVYISRLVLESTSATTLENVSYNSSDELTYSSSVPDNSSDKDATTVSTASNPNTGISDYVIFIVPVCIILGSAILIKRNYV